MTACPTPEKVAHSNPKDAVKHAESLRKYKYGSADVKPYKCRCGKWHVGHSQFSLAFRIRRARRDGIA